ncbi:Uma2 family endonuclease [Pseudanabaena sp. FACHB-1998]|uniref:Uma2 family endonuclease n=1 Tax=Pseudanabaena sp. FACHB-1998 TaxID=2692858 RepID=UPI0016800DA3|nr:Uma2 family endonuclease [Pseudanabaena sp. FACHB-1998]MBD2178957.1 Uma2 family endonuclease [Pseudanabaena sp. FACHB-1998]
MLVQTKRFTIAEYQRLADLGILQDSAEKERTELIRGEITQMAAKGTRHTVCCSNLMRELYKLVNDLAIIRCQDPIFLLPDSSPEPDFVIVRDREDNYLTGHPTPDYILLVIEIADSSIDYDRDIKGVLYAEAGIANYWLFNLVDNRLEIYSEPYRDMQGKGNYAQRRYVLAHESIAFTIFPNLDLQLEISKVLPKI